MNICINKSLPEFQDLLKESGLKESILAAKIVVWQVKNNLEIFPSLDQLLEKPEDVVKPAQEVAAVESTKKETPDSLQIDRLAIKNKMQEAQKGERAEKYLPKEFAKVDQATQFIGQGIGSTGKYALAWGDNANTGVYTSNDVVMLAANGKRSGAFQPIINGELQGEYKNIDKAIEAGASFVADTEDHLSKTGSYNVGEKQLEKYLESKGYTRRTVDGAGLWTKTLASTQKVTKKATQERKYLGDITVPASRKLANKNLEDTRAIVQDFIATFNNKLYGKIDNEGLGITFFKKFLTDPKTLDSVYKEVIQEIKNLYTEIVEESYNIAEELSQELTNENLSQQERQEIIEDMQTALFDMDLYLTILNDFDKLVELSKDYFKQFGISFDVEESLTEDQKDSKDSVELWQKEQIKVNPKTRASSVFKFIISSLKTDSQIETANLLLDNKKTADFGTMVSLLLNRLAGHTGIEEVISTITNIKNELNENDKDLAAAFNDLLKKLFTTVKKDENGNIIGRVELSLETVTDFNRDHLRMILEFSSYLNNNYNKYKLVQYDSEGRVVLFDPNLGAQRQKVRTEARKNFINRHQNFNFLVGAGSRQIFNSTALANSLYFSEENFRNSVFFDKSIQKEKEKKYNAVKTFFKFFGFNLPNLELNAISDQDLEDLFDIAYTLYNEVKNGKATTFYSDETDYTGYLNTVIDFIIAYNPSQYENSYTRSGGERIFAVALHSTLSRTVNAINRATSLEDLKRTDPYLFTEYSKNSQILKRGGLYFDSNGTRRQNTPISIEFLDEIGALDRGKDNNTFASAPSVDKMMSNFNSVLNNGYPIFRQGDNQQERHFKLISPLHRKGEKFKIEYLFDEIDHIIFLLQNNTKYKGINYSDIKAIVAKYPILDILLNKKVRLEKGSSSFEINSFLRLIKNGDTETIYQLLQDVENQNKINSAVDSFIDEKTQLLLDKMILEGGIREIGDSLELKMLYDKTRKIDENSTKQVSREVAFDIIKEGIVNQFYSNIEVSKFLSGPYIFYEDSDKFLQRMAGLVGTKTILLDSPLTNKIIEYLREDQGAPAYWKQDLYDSASLDSIPETYPEYQSLDENGEIILDQDSSGNATVKLLVSADPNSVSYMLDTLKNPDIVGIITDAYENMDEGDAFALATLDLYKELFERAGMWSDAQERLYQWYNRPFKDSPLIYRDPATGQKRTIRSRNEIRNADGSLVVFTVAKPQHFGNLIEEGFPPGMHKLSLMPILPEYIEEYPSFATIQKTLDKNNAGILLFPTANKVGTAVNEQGQVPSTYKPKEGKVRQRGEAVVDISDAIPQYTFAKNWGVQLSTGVTYKNKVTTGSQIAKIILVNIYENGKVKKDKEHLKIQTNELLVVTQSIIEKELTNLINRFGIELKTVDGLDTYTIKNKEELIEFLIEEISKRDVPQSFLESLEIIRDNSDLSEVLRFDVLPNREKLENILASIADSRVISRKTKGTAKVQAPSTFFEKNGVRQYANEKAQLISGTLKFYEDGVMEVMLPHWFKEYFSTALGRDLTDLNLKDFYSEIEKQAPELLKVVGFRIPTSGLNSVEAIKIAGFLPESAGETIVVPAEIVAKAGSDFDVDKLNLFFANYKINEKTGLPQYVNFINPENYKTDSGEYDVINYLKAIKEENNIEDEDFVSSTLAIISEDKEDLQKELVKLNTFEALENRRLELMHSIISDPSNKKDLLESIGIDLIKKEEERIKKEQGIPDSKKTARDVFGDVAYHADVGERNIDSKKLTGIASLHVVDLAHSQRYGYEVEFPADLAEYLTTGKKDMRKLGLEVKSKKQDGEEAIRTVNLSLGRQENIDGILISTILNQSVNAAVDGVKNPIFYNLNLNLETSSVAFLLLRAGFSLSKVFDFIAHPAIKFYTKKVLNNKSVANKYRESRENLIKETISYFEEQGLSDKEIKEYEKVLSLYENVSDGAASRLNTYIQSTRLDTQAAGKNTTQLELILYAAKKVAAGESGIKNAEKIYEEGGFLRPHYVALTTFQEMFSELFLVQDTSVKNVSFSSAYSHVLDYIINDLMFATLDEKTKVLDSFKNYAITHTVLTANKIKLKNFQTDRPLNTNIDLISGENSVAKRIERIKKVVLDSEGNVVKEGVDNNPFLNMLGVNFGLKGYKVSKNGRVANSETYDSVYIDTVYPLEQRFDSLELNQMQDAFTELFEHDVIRRLDPTLPYDLVQLMFLQGGLQNSPLSLLKFVPPKVYMEFIASAYENVYTDNRSNMYSSTDNLIVNFFASSYNNKNIFRYKSSFKGTNPNSLFLTNSNIERGVNNVLINLERLYGGNVSSILYSMLRGSLPNDKSLKEIQSNTIIDLANNTYILLPSSNILENPNTGKQQSTTIPLNKKSAYNLREAKKLFKQAAIIKEKTGASRLKLSKKYYQHAKAFKESTGQSIITYIRSKKVTRNTKESNKRNKSCRGK